VLTDDYQGPAAARLIVSKNKNATVFLVNDATDYAVGLQKTVDITLAGRVVGKDVTPQGTTDFSATIAKIKKSKATAVFYSGYFSQAAVFVKQLRDSGSKVVFASGDGTLDNQFIKLARKAAEGVLLTAPAIPFETASPKLAAEMVKAGAVRSTPSADLRGALRTGYQVFRRLKRRQPLNLSHEAALRILLPVRSILSRRLLLPLTS